MTFIPTASGFISTTNSSNVALTASQAFTGTSAIVTNYASITITIYSDQASGVYGLQAQFSTDNTNWNTVFADNVSAATAYTRSFPTAGEYFRLIYTNGSVSQTVFQLQTICHISKNGNFRSVVDTNSILTNTNNATILAGNSMNSAGRYREINVDNIGNLNINAIQPAGPFSTILTSNYFPIINLAFPNFINPIQVTSTYPPGSGSVIQSGNKAVIATGTTTSTTVSMNSVNTVKYYPGVGIIGFFSAIFSAGVNGTTQYIGFGNTQDGFMIGYNGNAFGILRRSSTTNNYISQSSFSVDTLDGNGPSGFVIAPTNGNIFRIDYQWLGYGLVNFYVESSKTGSMILFHQITYSNANTTTSINNPCLRVRVEVNNGSTTSNIQISTTSISAGYEGKPIFTSGQHFAANNIFTLTTSSIRNILSIMVKSTVNSITNYVPIMLTYLSYACTTTGFTRIELRYNATLTGATWTDVNTNESVTQYSTTDVGTIASGTVIGMVYLSTNDSKVIDLTKQCIFLTPGNTISICGYTTVASNSNAVGLNWVE